MILILLPVDFKYNQLSITRNVELSLRDTSNSMKNLQIRVMRNSFITFKDICYLN